MGRDDSLEVSRLFEEYHERVYRIILRLVGDPADAEELTQETFVKVYRSLSSLKQPEKASSWVYRIATNVALDRTRQRSYKESRRQVRLDSGGIDVPGEGSTPPVEVERDETTKCVRQFAENLPDQYRAVLVLHELEGLPLKEVAEATDSSLGATKVRLHRARKKFAALCSAECEQYRNEENILCCEPKSNTCCPS